MMRLNKKLALLFLCIAVSFITLSLWSRCSEISFIKESSKRSHFSENDKVNEVPGAKEIECVINGDYTIGCLKEGDEVFVPFTFLHKYFEIYGNIVTYDSLERFEWSHSYGRIYHPKGKYDPRGIFMHFENYNVEVRDRVKCVSAIDGVPISTQWESQGYYYPTQIAQFGLSHYSKNLTAPEPRRKVIEDGEKELANWYVPSGCSIVRSDTKYGKVLNFTSDSYNNPIKLNMDHVLDFVFTTNIVLHPNSSMCIVLQNREKKEFYNLHYIASDILITAQACSKNYFNINNDFLTKQNLFLG